MDVFVPKDDEVRVDDAVRQLIERCAKFVGTDDVERDAAPFRRLLQKAVDGQKLFGVQKRVDREQTSLHIASAYIIAQRRAKSNRNAPLELRP